jgi:hypothetical protein
VTPLIFQRAAIAAFAVSISAGTVFAQQASPAATPPQATAQGVESKPPPGRRPNAAAKPAPHVFALMAGSWTGGGTLTLSGGARERLRCRANHTAGPGGRSLSLSIRCASDSYRFELSSQVVERRGRIYGRWSEASNGVSGTISGSAAGNRVRAVATGDMFTAGLALTTQGHRQSVSITPRGVHITGVQIALRKR